MLVRSLAVAGLLMLVVVPATWARTWSDASGKFQVEAEFVSLEAGVVKLKRNDGKVIEVPLRRLAEADRAFVEKATAQPTEKKQDAAKQAKVKPQPPKDLDPMLAEQFITQVIFKDLVKVREMLVAEPGLVNCEHNYATPLIKACSFESLELVTLLVDAGADVNQATTNGNLPILDAVMRTKLEVVQYLIDQGADPKAVGGDGYTPLHRAATKENAELLLSLKADIAARTVNGDTPLHSTLSIGFIEVAELLIERGADIEAVGNFDCRPIHVACKTPFGDSLAMVEMLLAKKANVKSLGFIDSTVIHDAAFYNKPKLVKLFATQGIDLNAKNRNVQTALDLAKQSNNQEMINLLKKLGAKE